MRTSSAVSAGPKKLCFAGSPTLVLRKVRNKFDTPAVHPDAVLCIRNERIPLGEQPEAASSQKSFRAAAAGLASLRPNQLNYFGVFEPKCVLAELTGSTIDRYRRGNFQRSIYRISKPAKHANRDGILAIHWRYYLHLNLVGGECTIYR